MRALSRRRLKQTERALKTIPAQVSKRAVQNRNRGVKLRMAQLKRMGKVVPHRLKRQRIKKAAMAIKKVESLARV